jgi:branched-chain amino acid transport system ATP-binding protein
MPDSVVLEVEDLHVHYGKVEALKGVSFSVNEGEIVTLIGGNGAGKTTTLKTVSGVRAVSSGRLRFKGEDLAHVAAHRRVDMGICQAPEGRGIFPGMTVTENLEMGAYTRKTTKTRSKSASSSPSRTSGSSRGWPNAGGRRAARCPVVSSRCWPSAGH